MDSQSFLKMQTTIGTGKKLFTKDNEYLWPNKYKIKGFANEVKLKGEKINEKRIILNEKGKNRRVTKKMEKLREEKYEEKSKVMK